MLTLQNRKGKKKGEQLRLSSIHGMCCTCVLLFYSDLRGKTLISCPQTCRETPAPGQIPEPDLIRQTAVANQFQECNIWAEQSDAEYGWGFTLIQMDCVYQKKCWVHLIKSYCFLTICAESSVNIITLFYEVTHLECWNKLRLLQRGTDSRLFHIWSLVVCLPFVILC